MSSLLKRVLKITSFTLIPAETLALEVFSHPPVLFHTQISSHSHFTPLADYCVRLWVKMQICVRVGMSAQTPSMGTAEKTTALFSSSGDVQQVLAQWTAQVLVYTGTTGLCDFKKIDNKNAYTFLQHSHAR